MDFQLKLSEVLQVFDAWVSGAASRHFMVFKGHYRRYIYDYFEGVFNNVQLMGYRDSVGNLYGVAGWEEWGGCAQITLMKHRFGDYHFPAYFWANTCQYISGRVSGTVFCGTTADELKTKLGFTSIESWKIKI